MSLDDPPSRLVAQVFASTNCVVLEVVGEPIISFQTELYNLLSAAQLQALDFSSYESHKLVRCTFFDVRDAQRAYLLLQTDHRFKPHLDLESGTNRSVVFPRGNLSLDLIYQRMSSFGEIEKIWFNMSIVNYDADNVVVDYYDSRVPLSILRKLEQVATRNPINDDQQQQQF
jgi:hypothetical protein